MGLNIFKKQEQIIEERAIPYINGSNHIVYANDQSSYKRVFEVPQLLKGINLICGSIASLPIYLYKEDKNGNVKRVIDNRERLLNESANLKQTGFDVKYNICKSLLLHSKSYSVINKKGLKPTELYSLDASSISDDKLYVNDNGFIQDRYITYRLNGATNNLSYENFIIVNYSTGILQVQQILNEIINEIEAYNAIVNNTSSPSGVLKTNGRLSQPAVEKLRTAWQNLYSGTKSQGKTVILEEGLDYQQLNPTIINAELKTSIDIITEKCESLLNLPSGILNNSSIEKLTLLLSQTLNPIINSIEESLNHSLLLESEKKEGYYFRFDTKEFNRSGEEQKIQQVISLLNSGVLSINECRAILDYESLDKNYFKYSIGNSLSYDTGELFNINTNTIFDSNTGMITNAQTQSIEQQERS